VFLREHADVTGRAIALPEEPEAVLVGAAILGAVAAGAHPSVVAAMGAMTAPGHTVQPAGGDVARYHDKRHCVFLAMHEHQLADREMMR